MQRLEHFIGGAFVAPVEDGWLDNIDPATGQCIGTLARGSAADIDAAVAAAKAAAGPWASTEPTARAALLHAMADGIEADMDAFVLAESIDTGKPVSLAASVDIPRAVANLRYFADAAVTFCDRQEQYTTATASSTVHDRPVGVIGAISPWNLPLYLLTWKIAPALAMGNTVVAKPSEFTATTATMLGDIARAAGLPDGVLNIVHGLGVEAGAALVEHADVAAITFTGGTATGALVNQACAGAFKKVALEMGGKNPVVIFADADIDAAIDIAAAAAFANQGQICLCGERLLIEASVFDRVVAGVAERAAALRIGDPLDPDTRFGSLVSKAHRSKVEQAVTAAVADGATVVCGGCRPDNLPARVADGAFYEPTMLTGLGPDARFNREEVFGPVVCAMPFADEAEAIAMANGTDYGLCASVCTGDSDRAARMANAIDAGTVWINCWLVRDFRVPFGGMKHSGLGREGGEASLRFCTEQVTVCTATTSTVGASGAVPSEPTT